MKSLLVLSCALLFSPLIPSEVKAYDIDPSGYSLYSGGPFYVLTDGVFSTKDEIQVRFEAGGNTGLTSYGGVDVRLYRIPKPLEFLRAQKNLHRPDVKGRYAGEGLSNAFNYLWDSWYKKARLAWQRVFSPDARKTAVATAPELTQTPAHTYKTEFRPENQFKPLAGYELVDSFRYPVWQAKLNEPPRDTRMEGSSSNFIQTPAGNVLLPMGKRAPGLYLVEAMIGSYRATTLVFVSDSVVVSKVSSQQAFIWTADRLTGRGRAKARVVVTDGVGVLDQGAAGDDGVYISRRAVPERTFALVEDASGGVSVSENFFYDSEVAQAKVFVFTDRPLYQPGDEVQLRALGRDLKRSGSKDIWSAVEAKSASFSVIDASGVPLFTQPMKWQGAEGGEAKFKLPESAETGGYTLRVKLDGEEYGAAFRVARFTKPHFDAQILFDKPSYKVGEIVKGRLVLSYPSGQPVPNAEVDLQLRAEQMSMYEGNYSYQMATPVELSQKTYKADAKGQVAFSFPAATKPSRYIASARALDQAAYRVSTKREVLIEGYIESYLLKSEFNATQPGAAVTVVYDRQGTEAADRAQPLKTWQAIRLEDRSTVSGPVAAKDRGEFVMKLDKPGHYMVRVVDEGGVTRGVRSHVVLGSGMKSATGQVELLADKEDYNIGDTAKVLLTFPGPVEDALLTLERNDVSAHGRLSSAGSWYSAKKLGEAQWQIDVPIRDTHAPNIVFSVASLRNGEFSFQNKGLVVKKPMMDITFKPEKATYAPGEKVVINIETKLAGKPLAALVAVGVVDEMIYVLQPEIAPMIGEFFHHLRRNQVRTTSSQSFYSFNPATSTVTTDAPAAAGRDFKLMQERARRDARDTAYWNGSLKTDANGRARIEFVMPDALTRWRITARAIVISGEQSSRAVVGEAKGFVLSSKDQYLKWTGPTRFRQGDQARPTIVAFNATSKPVNGEIQLKGANFNFAQKIALAPGANAVVIDKLPTESQDLRASLTVEGKSIDALDTRLEFTSADWLKRQSQSVPLIANAKATLPASATNVRLKLMTESAYQFQKVADDLVEYPWGCAEQTASRLIPLAMAVKAIEGAGSADLNTKSLRDILAADRRRLVSMAGPGARFTWWGDQGEANLLITAHAHHADFRVAKLLDIPVPKENWEHLLKIYADAKNPTALERAYALWVLSYVGQPVTEQVAGLGRTLATAKVTSSKATADESACMDEPDTQTPLALLLLANLAAKHNVTLPPSLQKEVQTVVKTPWTQPALRAAILAYGVRARTLKDPVPEAEKILEALSPETPTIDRALALALLEEALPRESAIKIAKSADLGGDWTRVPGRGLPTYALKTKSGAKTPSALALPTVPGAVAEVVYDAPEEKKSTLKIALSRKYYRVGFAKPAAAGAEDEEDGLALSVTEVKPGEPLDSRALYIDEITVKKTGKGQFLLVEVPLPPGGDVDGSTWGLNFKGLETNFVEAKNAGSGLGYSIPIQNLEGEKKYHQLVRFSSRGSFQLPPAKIFRMYRPSDRAYEGTTSRALQVR